LLFIGFKLRKLSLEFYHLRSFVAVAQTGNLTQAAKRLYTTPPALSAHIKALEQELATLLFIRSSKGMKLTDKGVILLEKAQHTLDSALAFISAATAHQHELIGTFRLGVNVTAEQSRLTELIENLRAHWPNISLDLHQQASGKTICDIREQKLDGGYILGAVPDDFVGITVKQQKITIVAPRTFDIRNIVTPMDLSEQPWIMMGNYCPFDDLLRETFGNRMPSTLKAADNSTRLELVKNGLGLSFLESEAALLAEQQQQVQIVSLLDFSMPLHFVIAKHLANEALHQALLQEIRILWDLSLSCD
jgi:DNA-binding transcriptional LysR family regulator